jgi:sigma-B regulation protein RsbU (phosphoserine phosphatase)
VPELQTIIFTGLSIIAFSYATLFILNRTTMKINSTRKQLKAQKAELEKTLTERDRAYRMLNDELRVAESYVRKMLPEPLQNGCVQTDWLFVPSAVLGGDAFGYHWLDGEHFVFYLLDVSGHGVGAALYSVSLLNALRAQSLKHADFRQPRQVLQALNATFPSENHDDMFFTIWYGVFNRRDNTLRYASAGHPPAILLADSRPAVAGARLLKCRNCAVGALRDVEFSEDRLQIREKCSLYLYSDGVYEVDTPEGSMWRFDEFQNYLKRAVPVEGSRIEQLYRYVLDLKGADTLDDDFSIMELVFAD